ncbi:unnamed protein product [Brassica rapa]|uniref:Uncharacterized protein n=1 Tax=Brassica campestris TaxID=3711 RepID=A0A8D9GN87_BRACM|nr:unnamed protein product [Brassica rapa]
MFMYPRRVDRLACSPCRVLKSLGLDLIVWWARQQR